MNKKNLSVVLAGAMLATTVAPVLAETTVSKEYTTDELALLKKEIEAKMNEEKISDYAALQEKDFVAADVKDLMGAGKSAYGIKVVGKDGKDKDLNTLSKKPTAAKTTYGSKVKNNVTYTIADVANVLHDDNIAALTGCTIQIVKLKTTDFKGQVIPGSEITKVEDTEETYKARADFLAKSSETIASSKKLDDSKGVGKDLKPSTYPKYISNVEGVGKVYDITTDKENTTATTTTNDYYKEVKVTTTVPNDIADPSKNTVEMYLKEGDKKIDARLPLDADGKLLDVKKDVAINSFKGFETKSEWKTSKLIEEAPENIASYKINAVESNENTLKASDLYDGVALTAKGTELATDLANAKDNTSDGDAKKSLVKISKLDDSEASMYKFQIHYYKNETNALSDDEDANATAGNPDGKKDADDTTVVAYKTVTVYSSNINEMKSLYGMLTNTGSYKVGIIGGANRYETAVNIAKTNDSANFTAGQNANIVLVNGESLVDGLSAAPLAAKLVNNSGKAAPVLLTKSDKLHESTKEYIKTLTSSLSSKADKRKVTVSLVGGKSVLSENIVAELEDMGFTVVRYGGANREATSLKVAEKLADANNENSAFVVGGNGEADAMAISAVAAENETPIIVSSVHGLSKNALTYINEKSAKGDVTIVGGTSVVSEDEEKAINESLTLNKASRIAGENRFETNAKIIKECYTKASVANVILAKDGQSNKGELVDALAAANLAAELDAPIVLATSSLKANQKNELLNVKAASTTKLLQVGQGVERSVLEEIAGLLGLSNK